MKKTPLPRSKPKYMSAFPEGMLLVADWKFPGKSLTPFVTLRTQELHLEKKQGIWKMASK